jgi:nitrate reductase assembly molybdenum cofactor insertion protein NarJ
MSSNDPKAGVDTALGRALVYDFFAQAFAYPAQERFEDLQRLSSIILTGGGWVPLMRLAAVARELTPELLQAEYVATLTLSSSPDYPMFETAYFGNDPQQQTQRMADVAGFYRSFGVDASNGDLRPDDLPVELEFMSFLCQKEAYAIEHLGAPRVAQAKKAQRLFFKDHLGRWAGVAGRKLGELGPAGLFYAVAGATLDAWVSAEAESLGVHPEEVTPGVPMIWPLPMSHGPEFAGDASFVPLEELAVR